MLAMRSGNWKFLMDPDGTHMQLYNLQSDKLESNNLVTKEPDRTNTMAAQLQRWYESVVRKNTR
jgi:hypothetical protein